MEGRLLVSDCVFSEIDASHRNEERMESRDLSSLILLIVASGYCFLYEETTGARLSIYMIILILILRICYIRSKLMIGWVLIDFKTVGKRSFRSFLP